MYTNPPYLGFTKKEWSDLHGIVNNEPSMTVQSQAQEADINFIVRQFGITGKLPQGVRVPSYGDFDSVDDYQSAIAAIRSAESSFALMPADVRAKFDNDAGRFVDFCSDSSNLDEMRKLGLAVPAPPVPPVLATPSS